MQKGLVLNVDDAGKSRSPLGESRSPDGFAAWVTSSHLSTSYPPRAGS
jgi:hypothetical protein